MKEYHYKNELKNYLIVNNYTEKEANKVLLEFKNNSDLIEIDPFLYIYLNKSKIINHNNILDDIYYNGVLKGYIYSIKQLKHYDKEITGCFVDKNNELFLKKNDEYLDLKNYVNNLYKKNFEDFLNDIQCILDYDINFTQNLICSYINNKEYGSKLLNKIIINNKNNLLNLIIFDNIQYYNDLKDILNNFDKKIIFISNKYCNDVIPTIQALYYCRNINYKFVTKLTTINYEKLNEDSFNKILSLDDININTIGTENINYKNKMKYNHKIKNCYYNKFLIDKYKHFINNNFYVPYSILKFSKETLNSILKFMKNNYITYFLNNMYDNNNINVLQSPIHFLERLFSMLKFNITNIENIIINLEKIGVVITTNGNWGINVKQCIECYLRELKNKFIVLYINESSDPITLSLKDLFPEITVIYINDQKKNGGLTATWNDGIDLCLNNNCNSIILSNDDILFDSSINNIIYECVNNNNKFQCYVPLTNNPGPAKKNHIQYGIKPLDKIPIILNKRGLNYDINGFFMVFPSTTLIKNKFDNKHYFDPKFPFGGNENEWYNRLLKKGGNAKLIYKTFIYHYKFARWRNNNNLNNKCLYTINTGNYEGNKIYIKPTLPIDYLYFTDNFNLIYECIRIGILPFYIYSKDTKLIQRTVKTSPHKYLPNIYDISIYVDGNIIPKMTNDSFNKLLKYNTDILCFEHPTRKSVLDEMIEVLKLKLEKKSNIEKIITMMNKDNFKNNIGLTETNVLIRKHKNIILFSEEWTKCIKMCRRDQISFDYLLYNFKIKYKRLTNNTKNTLINKNKHINPFNREIK